ncbi:beta subunit of N-acylethanolamine-hydrolyzing acid amidase-domain-containing protein [Aspergillus aurantiobrunneus]
MTSSSSTPGEIPPTHRINLSLPPATRYAAIARLYRPKLLTITSLFDDLVLSVFPPSYLPRIKLLARLLLRRVYDDEENQEIRGIADTTGIDLYLVVALNVLLDLLMGCTSGAALSSPSEGQGGQRMLHFRTLDWDMPLLRQLLVKLEFVSSDAEDSPVLATNITYVGFVGVLTGIRQGLSVSLNFRPNHDASSWVKQVKYYGRLLLVLLGLKRSISSMLRQVVIPTKTGSQQGWLSWLGSRVFVWKRQEQQTAAHQLSLSDTVSRIVRTPSTACYLILCDGRSAYVLEKDYKTTKVESSSSFIVATNSDRAAKVPRATDPSMRQEHTGASLTTGEPVVMADFIKDSIERRECMQAHWDMKVVQARQAARRAQARKDPLRRTRSSQKQTTAVSPSTAATTTASADIFDPEVAATLDEIVTWTTRFPTTNEMTHFTTIMDPTRGTVVWIRRYPEPLECDWDLTDFD